MSIWTPRNRSRDDSRAYLRILEHRADVAKLCQFIGEPPT